jgi:zinc D-Ala-D-Ala carboxypeptidase
VNFKSIVKKLSHEKAVIALSSLLIISFVFSAYIGKVLIQSNLNNQTRIAGLQTELESLQDEKLIVEDALYSEQNKNKVFENQIKEIAGLVGVLDKLSKTDPELLQKYSKVYFLNEHYTPSKLTTIDKTSTYPVNKELFIHDNVGPFLARLLESAGDIGIKLKVISAYRSFDTQADLKSNYKVIYGAGTANQFSADQGYSEHQLGTAVDFTTTVTGNDFNKFDKTEEFKWLKNNAHRFGFILSYPEGNSYYLYEPWHWRFVGVSLATWLYDNEKFFYDIDQRTINDYLVNLFD